MNNLIKRNRQNINRDLKTIRERRLFSPVVYGLARRLTPLIEEYAGGKFLDIGCGDMPFRPVIEPKVAEYHTLDIEKRTEGVMFMGDIQDMSVIQNGAYDTAFSSEVLEHVPDPGRALREVCRVLKPGGTFIFSVPHLSRLHEEPRDYYRYTHYGLRYLLENNGFECITLRRTSGLLSFLGHQWSTLVLGLFWGVPLLKHVVLALNLILVTLPCFWLDEILLSKSPFPQGYVGVARKKT